METPAPFVDSAMRIDRASQQFNSLKSEITEWLRRQTYQISVKNDVRTREGSLELIEVEPTPTSWPLVSSEIVGHLRAALDNAIYHVSVAHTGQQVPRTEFPIFIEEEDFVKNGLKRVRGIPDRVRAVVETAQPCRNDQPKNNALWVLHELCNSEKHQQLPVVEIFRNVDVSVSHLRGIERIQTKHANPGPLKDGTEIARWKIEAITGEGDVKVDFKLARDIVLDVARPPCVAGHSLISVLDLCGEITLRVLRAMIYEFQAWQSPQN